ncbi:DUF2913 family protein [Shewanella sp. OMA3-2]|uniref:DUF2913 family protein n=1 Tax=Shewanella sp. OMA3-2 TaxID=2908650 RepID=UPI001F361246|nr:DUF2913 family protein [Shewanella sp. OMA3-2]UJF21582.1 DUF2913 family protein [Shewanella sp. OMA3-2]
MTETYNSAVLNLAVTGIHDLTESNKQHKGVRTPAQESHFLCSWMVDSLKAKRFSKLVAEDLTQWIRLGRSQGAGAQLKQLLERIVIQYQDAKAAKLGDALDAVLADFAQQNWLVVTDTPLSSKLKLDGDGQSSVVVCAVQMKSHRKDAELLKPIALYVRGDENVLAEIALQHGLLISQANKKTTLIKHHKTYLVIPKNQHASLCLLARLK